MQKKEIKDFLISYIPKTNLYKSLLENREKMVDSFVDLIWEVWFTKGERLLWKKNPGIFKITTNQYRKFSFVSSSQFDLTYEKFSDYDIRSIITNFMDDTNIFGRLKYFELKEIKSKHFCNIKYSVRGEDEKVGTIFPIIYSNFIDSYYFDFEKQQFEKNKNHYSYYNCHDITINNSNKFVKRYGELYYNHYILFSKLADILYKMIECLLSCNKRDFKLVFQEEV